MISVASTGSTGSSIRKRCPSGETSYCNSSRRETRPGSKEGKDFRSPMFAAPMCLVSGREATRRRSPPASELRSDDRRETASDWSRAELGQKALPSLRRAPPRQGANLSNAERLEHRPASLPQKPQTDLRRTTWSSSSRRVPLPTVHQALGEPGRMARPAADLADRRLNTRSVSTMAKQFSGVRSTNKTASCVVSGNPTESRPTYREIDTVRPAGEICSEFPPPGDSQTRPYPSVCVNSTIRAQRCELGSLMDTPAASVYGPFRSCRASPTAWSAR